jgi:hypothetical protein
MKRKTRKDESKKGRRSPLFFMASCWAKIANETVKKGVIFCLLKN